MKGSISEFELGILRRRIHEAREAKARRGELRVPVPVGFIWDRDLGIGFDPDLRVQEVVRLISPGSAILAARARHILAW